MSGALRSRAPAAARLCALVLLAGTLVRGASAAKLVFERLDAPAPPHRSVYALLEDRDGFLWVGTLDGLGRYDGYEMRVFRHDPRDPRTLSNNSVHMLLEDRRGTLWVGTENGLNILDRTSMELDRIETFRDGPESSGWFTCAFEDRSGVLWFGTDGGLVRHDPLSGGYDLYGCEPGDPRSLPHPSVIGVQQDRLGAMWVATSDGVAHSLGRLEAAHGAFERFPVEAGGRLFFTFLIDREDRFWLHPDGSLDPVEDRLSWPGVARPRNHSSRAAVETAVGDVWIGCSDGLYRLPAGSEPVERHLMTERPGAWLENYVRALHQGRSGILWVGTQGGLYRLDPHAKPFTHLGAEPDQPGTLSAAAVSAVVEAADGGLWVGTYGGGLNRVDPSGVVVWRTCPDPDRMDECPARVVWDLHLDDAGVLWIVGTHLWSLSEGSTTLTRHEPQGAPPAGLTRVVEQPAGTLWLAGVDGVLYRYRPGRGEVRAYPEAAGVGRPWEGPRLDSLFAHDRIVWMAAGNRLCRLEIEAEQLECFPLETSDGVSLRSQGTWAIHGDGDGSLWLGTSIGLVHHEPASGALSLLTTHDGLPGSAVYSILEDGQGRLWLGTNQGLSCFDRRRPEGERFRNYSSDDGLDNTEFNRHAAVRTSTGRLLLGGMDGLTALEPSRFRTNPFVPPVRLTRIQVWSRDGERSVNPFRLDRLVVSHRDATFGFEFAALSFTDPQQNRYAYQLEGFDPEARGRAGQGLRSMRRRAEEIDAVLELRSEPGRGTSVAVTVDLASSRDGEVPGRGTTLEVGSRSVEP